MALGPGKWRMAGLVGLAGGSLLFAGHSSHHPQASRQRECRCPREDPVSSGPGTQRMGERLEKAHRAMNVAENRYANKERLELFRWQSRDPTDPRLALEYLRTGHSAEAIARFEKLLAKIPINRSSHEPRFRSQVRHALAISHLRLGEQENCISQHNADSCLFPLQGGGIHTIQRGSRSAVKEYLALLQDDPSDREARWLLNIASMTLGEYPDGVPKKWRIPTAAFRSDYEIKRFPDVAPLLGLDVMGLAGGSILEDFDSDGDLDIMASSWGYQDALRYFQNNGDGSFTDCSNAAALEGVLGGLNIIQGDYNNDGHPDVFLLRGAWLEGSGRWPNSLLRSNGDGTFEDVTEKAGLLSFHPTQTAAWGDFDNDGWLDLFVGNETTQSADSHPCELFRNNGDGTFTNVASQAGVAFTGWVKGVAWGDYDNDGRPDLYLSCLTGNNLLYRNEGPSQGGAWRFRDVTRQAGVAAPYYSFPVWFWDYDNDGWLDLFVSGYAGDAGDLAADYLGLKHDGEQPRLYRNKQDGTFEDVTEKVKLNKMLLTMGCNFGDLDNDGFLDFYLGTGAATLRSLVPNRMFRNDMGKVFQDVTASGGFGHLQKGHGVSFGDIDNDGDQDIYSVIGGAYSGDLAHNVLFQNPGQGNRWITLRLQGVRSNRSAIGARIRVSVKTRAGERHVYSVVSSGGSFGASSLQQEIGLGQADSISALEVLWPSGHRQKFAGVPLDQVMKIVEDQPRPFPVEARPFELATDPRRLQPPPHQR